MNDVVVRVLVPLDPNAASSSSKVAKTAAPAGFEEVQETLPGIFSLKVLKHNLCKRRYWNADNYRLILRTFEDEVLLEAADEDVDVDDDVGRNKGGGRGQAQAPLADRKEGAAGGIGGGMNKKVELWTWLQDEDTSLMDIPGIAGGGEVYLEARRPDGGWPTDRFDPVKAALVKAEQARRRQANQQRRAKQQPDMKKVNLFAVVDDVSTTTSTGGGGGQRQQATEKTEATGQQQAAPSGWSAFLQQGRDFLSGAQGGGWYDDEDEWEKPQQASGFPAFSAPPGYQMSEEEQLQAAMMLSRVAADEDADKEQDFEGLMLSKGLLIKKISDDGNCLFGAVADQAYADPALHAELRKQCLDYMEKDRDHFSQFVTEDFEAYVLRKRCLGVYANNPEIQALSEMLGRPIEVYSYASEPMNTFQGAGGGGARPIRISYHRGNHYNSLRSLDPTTEEAPLPALAPSGAAAATTAPPSQATPAGEGENACFLCGQQCVDYEDLQIHMFTTCEKKDLL
ncbi:OTUlike cysteine protease [Acanthamoeba castellanii str. Neff]|uniref:ubiquitinyl hydrolase 1 n=1 Tax=Acanthamoeba castellanii (strain ATCC 30010 / Neff) TaxID=1257118 RepID=L8GH30_ACACF|nr:OTUlike cysteine protease [Acanthamoeba castellanii str. Neff]ELR12119.1 OTUlike cysteine protease [Acanthamoeba castellanii str. Neff]